MENGLKARNGENMENQMDNRPELERGKKWPKNRKMEHSPKMTGEGSTIQQKRLPLELWKQTAATDPNEKIVNLTQKSLKRDFLPFLQRD